MRSMWRYLREFLSDTRVIELNKAVWYPILYGLVLTTRPQKSGANYAKIWNRERDESPLRTITRAQSEKLAAALAAHAGDRRRLGDALRQPFDPQRRRGLEAQGCDRMLTFPLYPAIFGDDDRHGQRPAVPRADEDAPGAGRPQRAALL